MKDPESEGAQPRPRKPAPRKPVRKKPAPQAPEEPSAVEQTPEQAPPPRRRVVPKAPHARTADDETPLQRKTRAQAAPAPVDEDEPPPPGMLAKPRPPKPREVAAPPVRPPQTLHPIDQPFEDNAVRLPLEDAKAGVFPSTCALTGEPADTTITVYASGAPAWAYLFLIPAFILGPGVLIGLIVIRAMFPNARLALPVTARAKRSHRLWAGFGVSGLIVGIVLALAAALNGATGLTILGVVLSVAGIGSIINAARVAPTARIESDHVVLRRVHPSFAQEAHDLLPEAPIDPRDLEEFENTSGAGRLAEVPPVIRRWNWGAFLLNWVWAIGNKVWIGLLALVPVIGIWVPIYLGVKGNERAWREKRWDSVESFLNTQRIWSIVGGIYVGASVMFIVVGLSFGWLALPDRAGQRVVAQYEAGEIGETVQSPKGFTAVFPRQPKEEVVSADNAGPPVPLTMLIDEIGGEAAFMVSMFDLPPDVSTETPRALLRSISEGSASEMPGVLTSYAETAHGAYPAADIAVSARDGVYMKGRVILQVRRVYMLQVLANEPVPPGYERFVGSFGLSLPETPA